MTTPGSADSQRLTPRRRPLPGRTAAFLLVSLLIACDIGLVALPVLAARESVRVQSAEVISETRLRAEPRHKGKPLVRLPPGSHLTVRGKPEDGWYRAERGAIEGYVLSGVVATAPLPAGDDALPGEAIDDPAVVELAQRAGGRDRRDKGERKAERKRKRKEQRKAQRQQERRDRERQGSERDDSSVVTSTVLNLRAEPAQDAGVLTTIPRGERVAPTGAHEDGWVELGWKGETGWALGRYLAAPKPRRAKRDKDPGTWSRSELKAIIFEAADRYGQPREDMLRVARCESDMTPSAVNEHGGSYGLFQFKPGTWLSTPFAEYDIFDPRASAYATAWMWSEGRRREWVCQ